MRHFTVIATELRRPDHFLTVDERLEMNNYVKLASGTPSFGYDFFILKVCISQNIFDVLIGIFNADIRYTGFRVTSFKIHYFLLNAIYLKEKLIVYFCLIAAHN